MPAPVSCDELLDVVRQSGVVDVARLGEFLGQWSVPSEMPEDPGALAEEMLKAGIITSYQKDQLLQGKRRGYLLANNYILLDHIGSGGMGNVYLCEHKVMKRRVAIKVLPNDFAKDPEYLERFHREARAAAALDHPNIVRAHDAGQDGKLHFLVMEYIEGVSLHDLVRKEGPLEYQRASDYMAQAAAGLEHAHEAGLIHRDIKPANLLVDRRGTVKILDMGLALFFQERESLTKQYDANAILGTADYLAPEQAIDSHGVDIRADIYSLGLTFFFLLTGKNPYSEGTIAQKLLWHALREVKSVREYRPEIPEGLAAIVSKMIAKDKAQRFQTPREVAEALEPWVRGTAEAASSNGVAAPAPPVSDSAPTEKSQKEETLNGTPAQPAAVPGSGKKKNGSSVRSDKADSEATRTRGAKGAKASDSDAKTAVAKKPKPSGKKKAKETRAFWTRQKVIVLVATALGLLPLVAVGGYIFAQKRISSSFQKAVGTNVSKNDTSKPVVPPETKKVDPPKVDPPKVDPPKTTTPTPMPMPKPPTPMPMPKIDPPKTTPTPMPPPPVVKKPQPLADFFPKVGAKLQYDVATYPSGAILRKKWEYKDKATIEITDVQSGVVEGKTLLQGGTVRLLRPMHVKETHSVKTTQNRLEFSSQFKTTSSTLWEPILPLMAAEGDTWKGQLPSGGEFKKYTVVRFEQHKGKPAVVIRDSYPVAGDSEIVTERTYVQGIGEVTRTVTGEKKGEKPQLLSEWKLVDE